MHPFHKSLARTLDATALKHTRSIKTVVCNLCASLHNTPIILHLATVMKLLFFIFS